MVIVHIRGSNVPPFQGQDFGPAGSGVEQCEEDPIERALAAYPLSAALICEILGVPTGDRGQFKTWVEDIGAFVGGVGSYAERAADQADASWKELTRLFRELTLQRRREPRQDLISALGRHGGRGGRADGARAVGIECLPVHGGL